MNNFALCYRSALPHGILCGVKLPSKDIDWNLDAIKSLHKSEMEYAKNLKGLKQSSWVGGRLASKHALKNFSSTLNTPILSDPYGQPIPPKGFVISITHKENIAIAMVANDHQQSIGIDFEHFVPSRMGIMTRVLCPMELKSVQSLPLERQWIATLIRFSTKEAIYKALAPYHKRYIDFQEVSLELHTDGKIDVELNLAKKPIPSKVEARYIWLEDGIITTVNAKWR